MQRSLPPRASALRVLLACVLAAGCTSTPVVPPGTRVPSGSPTVPHPSASSAPPVTPGPSVAPVRTAPASPGAVAASVLRGFPDGVIRVAWSPDGRMLATAAGGISSTAPGTDRVWLWTAAGAAGPVLKGHSGRVLDLAWSPDSGLLASGSADGTVRLWRADGSTAKVLKPKAGKVFSVAWSPDSQRLAVGASRSTLDNTAEIWSRAGKLQSTLHTSFSGGKFYNVAWSPDGRYLAAGATDYALWTADGTLIGRTDGQAGSTPAWSLAWRPDSTQWATGNESGYIRVLDLQAQPLDPLQTTGGVDAMAWSPDGHILAAQSQLWAADESTIGSLAGFDGEFDPAITSLAWSPDGSMLAAGNRKGAVGLFNAAGDRLLVLSGSGSPDGTKQVNRLAWSPDGATLAVGYQDSVVRLWRVGSVLLP